jgi:hypothetical protein
MLVEANIMDSPAAPGIPGAASDGKKEMSFKGKFVIKNENTGEKIKDTADRAGVISSISTLILGLYICDNVPGLMGFVVGFVLAGAGIAASSVLVSLLYSYGDMISNSIEQTKILKRLEAKKIESIPQSDVSGKLQQPEQAAETIDQNAATDLDQAETAFFDNESSAVEMNADEINKNKLDLPSEAYDYDKSKRIAHFEERSRWGVICPVCGKLQTADDDTCFRCSCVFIFNDERTNRKGRSV